jgi:hypothetical protein
MAQSLSGYIQFSLFMLCGFVTLLSPAFAQPPSLSSPRQGRLERLLEEVGLDERTLGEVRKVFDTSKSDRQELRRKLREAYEHMRFLLEQENPNEAAVMTQAEVIGGLQTAARKQRLRTLIQVRALLTPEQRAKLLELMRARHRDGPCGSWRSPGERSFEERENPSPSGGP